MKILCVSGSPKAAGSASRAIIDALESRLAPRHELRSLRAVSAGPVTREDLDADALVLVFPLYVDSLPAPLLEWLISYRDAAAARRVAEPGWRPGAGVYAVANCGFHEGVQNGQALRIVRNFSAATGLAFGAALGIGTGGMFAALADVPDRARIKRRVAAAIDGLAGLIGAGERTGEIRFAQFALPRFAFILAAHLGWRSWARANGLRPAELRARP